MLARLSWLYCSSILVFLILSPFCFGQDLSGNSPHTVTRECSFPKENFSLRVDLGVLPAGKTVRANLLIRNAGSKDFAFESAKPNCSCTDFKIDKDFIKVDDVAVATVEFEVPEGNVKHFHSAHVDFQIGGEVVGRIVAFCEIQGSLKLGNAQHVFAVSPGVMEYRIPIYFSEPITFENLRSMISEGDFADIELLHEIKKDSTGQVFLSVMVPSADMESRFLSGSFRIRDAVADREASTHLLFTKSSPVDIAPRNLRFKSVEGETEKKQANALIRVFRNNAERPEDNVENPKDEDASSTKANDVRILARFDNGEAINLKVKRLSGSVFRVVVQATEDELRNQNSVKWGITVSDVEYLLETPIYGRK